MLSFLAALAAGPSDAALNRMLATERAFSKTCGIVGIRDSFLQFFAPDGLMFTPEPVVAATTLSAQPALKGPPRAVLSWWPTYGDMAISGDLGYSTGPFCLTETATGRKTWNGVFFSIWQRESDGQYRVVVDRGVSLSAPRDASQAPTKFERAPDLGPKAWTGPTADGAESALLGRAKEGSYGEAVRTFAAPGARIYRPGEPPMSTAALKDDAKLDAWTPVKTGSSQAGDLTYFVGSYAEKNSKGVYVHVWRRNSAGKWGLAIDIRHPNESSG